MSVGLPIYIDVLLKPWWEDCPICGSYSWDIDDRPGSELYDRCWNCDTTFKPYGLDYVYGPNGPPVLDVEDAPTWEERAWNLALKRRRRRQWRQSIGQ